MRFSALRTFVLLLTSCTAFSIHPTAEAAGTRSGTVFLLLHGLDSDPTIFNQTVRDLFGGNCRTLEISDTTTDQNRCYRYHFSDGVWTNGDGLSFKQLGDEVGQALAVIDAASHPAGVVLIGHSRGGLAARAWLQAQATPPQYKVGLVTLGTPHLGSPFGRIKPWMDRRGYNQDDLDDSPITALLKDELRFIFSPSTGTLATDHNESGQLVCNLADPNSVSYAICNLKRRARLANLVQNVTAFGQLTSSGLILGEKAIGGELNLFDDVSLTRALPGSFSNLRGYILRNIAPNRESFCRKAARNAPGNWACNGDGVVPRISQNLHGLLRKSGFRTRTVSQKVTKIIHHDLPEQTLQIQGLLDGLASVDGDLR